MWRGPSPAPSSWPGWSGTNGPPGPGAMVVPRGPGRRTRPPIRTSTWSSAPACLSDYSTVRRDIIKTNITAHSNQNRTGGGRLTLRYPAVCDRDPAVGAACGQGGGRLSRPGPAPGADAGEAAAPGGSGAAGPAALCCPEGAPHAAGRRQGGAGDGNPRTPANHLVWR